MANLSYNLSTYTVGTARKVNPGRFYPEDLNLMQEFQQKALENLCGEILTPGIVSNVNPIYNTGSLAVTVLGRQFSVSPGLAIFKDGVQFSLTQRESFPMDIPATQDASYVLVLTKTPIDTATRYNTELQITEVVETGWTFSFDVMPVGVFLPKSLLTNNLILLSQLLVDISQENYTILYGDEASIARPWFTMVDTLHRSEIGTGVVSPSNPHGLSINDLDGLPGLSFYEQQDIVGVISTYSGGPNHYGDFTQVYIPSANPVYIPDPLTQLVQNADPITTLPTYDWLSTFTYTGGPAVISDVVKYGNVWYKALQDSTNSQPDLNPTDWLPDTQWNYRPLPGVPVAIDLTSPYTGVYAYQFILDTGAAHVLSVVDASNGTSYIFQYDRSNKTVTVFSPAPAPWADNGLTCYCLVIHAGLVTHKNDSGTLLDIEQPTSGEYIVTPGGVISSLPVTEFDVQPLSGIYGTYDLMINPSGMVYSDPYPLIQTNLFNLKNQPSMSQIFLQVPAVLNIGLTNLQMPSFTTEELSESFLTLKISGQLNGADQLRSYQIYPINAVDFSVNKANYLDLPDGASFLAKDLTTANLFVRNPSQPDGWNSPTTFTLSSAASTIQCIFPVQAGVDLGSASNSLDNPNDLQAAVEQLIVPIFPDNAPTWDSISTIKVDQASSKLGTYTGVVIQYPVNDPNSIPLSSFTLSRQGRIISLSDIRAQRVFFEKEDGSIFYENLHNPLNFNPAQTKYLGRGLEKGIWESRPLKLLDGTYRLVVVFDSYNSETSGEVKASYRSGTGTLTAMLDSGAEIAPNKKIFSTFFKAATGDTSDPDDSAGNPTKYLNSWVSIRLQVGQGTRVSCLWLENSIDQTVVLQELHDISAAQTIFNNRLNGFYTEPQIDTFLQTERDARIAADNAEVTARGGAITSLTAHVDNSVLNYNFNASPAPVAGIPNALVLNGSNVNWHPVPYTSDGVHTSFVGAQKVSINTDNGHINFQPPTSSFWSEGIQVTKNDGTGSLGIFGWYGSADALSYHFIGGTPTTPKLKIDELGNLTVAKDITAATGGSFRGDGAGLTGHAANLTVGAADSFTGSFPSPFPTGMVMPYMGSETAARNLTGWLICNGDPIDPGFSNLMALIGNHTPDFRGRVPVGFGGLWMGAAAVNTAGGSATHTLAMDEMPSHTHDFAGWAPSPAKYDPGSAGGLVTGQTQTTTATGAGPGQVTQAFDIIQPYIVVVYIIKT